MQISLKISFKQNIDNDKPLHFPIERSRITAEAGHRRTLAVVAAFGWRLTNSQPHLQLIGAVALRTKKKRWTLGQLERSRGNRNRNSTE